MSRNLVRLSLLAMMLACCLAMILSFTAVPKASAATHVDSVATAYAFGGINLRAYCQAAGYADVRLIGNTDGTTVGDWYCVSSLGGFTHIDNNWWDGICNWMYPEAPHFGSAKFRATNWYDATSGVCYHVYYGGQLGGVNLRGYCQSLGYADVTTVGSTMYDWRCVGWDGSLAGINLDLACDWQYGGSTLMLFYDNFYVMTSGSCWD